LGQVEGALEVERVLHASSRDGYIIIETRYW